MDRIPYDHITVLIMPTDYCNMNCVYCFNNRKTNRDNSVMSLELLKHTYSTILPFYKSVKFIWHGGEPTSAGIEFFQKAIDMQAEMKLVDTKIKNSIQSNLTLVDEEMARFLTENHFGVGGSFDGISNEKTRHCSERILRGRSLIVNNGGTVGFIEVVQRNNVNMLIDDYLWFKKNNINYTLNMYMTDNPGDENSLFVNPEEYGRSICELFDYWLFDTECNIQLSYFSEFLNYIILGKKSLCLYTSCLGKYIAVRKDGSIYQCNRDFSDSYSFGNVLDYEDIRDCFKSEGFKRLVESAVVRRKKCMNKCELFNFCAGGCNSSSIMGGDVHEPNAIVCKALKIIYYHIKDRVEQEIVVISEKKNTDEYNPFFIDILKRSPISEKL